MMDTKLGDNRKLVIGLSLLFLCAALILSDTLTAQTSQTPASSAVVMVEIQCKPGMADLYREELEKEVVPAIREAIQKGDAFTNFTYLEAPLPAQDIDLVLLFEVKSFASLDTRRIPPHYAVMLHHMGPERFAAVMKEMGGMEKMVRVTMMRSYKVQ